MYSAYSTDVSKLFTRGSHHCNINLVLITQKIFHQPASSRDISLNGKYTVLFKNTRDKILIVLLALQVYLENISGFHKTYPDVCTHSHTYLFLYLTQSNNLLLRFGTKIFPRGNYGSVTTCSG